MRTILVIADHSAEAEHAAAFALTIAQTAGADLLIAETVKINWLTSDQFVLAGTGLEPEHEHRLTIKEKLSLKIDLKGSYTPVINEIEIADHDAASLIALVNSNDIWLMVEGMPHTLANAAGSLKINMQRVLNRVRCPLLLIPQCWELKTLERIVYMADLRYCRRQVLRYLTGVAAPFDAGISVAHLSARGLMDIVDTYAAAIFRDEIVPFTHYEKLTLNNIRERDLHKAVDVLINGLHNDLLVMVNHRYHFEEIMGTYIGDTLPAEITIPVLIFPL